MPSTEQDQQLWQQFVNQANAYNQSRQVFFQQCKDRITIIREALHNPSQRRVALLFFEYLNETECQDLFDDLIDLASVGHSDIELVRQVILSFPQSYLLAKIESSAEIFLGNGTDEEYRRLLELYLEIDISLVRRLIDRALKSSDPDIYEVGEDFQHYLIDNPIDNISLNDDDLYIVSLPLSKNELSSYEDMAALRKKIQNNLNNINFDDNDLCISFSQLSKDELSKIKVIPLGKKIQGQKGNDDTTINVDFSEQSHKRQVDSKID